MVPSRTSVAASLVGNSNGSRSPFGAAKRELLRHQQRATALAVALLRTVNCRSLLRHARRGAFPASPSALRIHTTQLRGVSNPPDCQHIRRHAHVAVLIMC